MSISIDWNHPIIRAGIKELWENRVAEGYADWNAYGRCCFEGKGFHCGEHTEADTTSSNLMLFTQSQCDISAWMNALVPRVHNQRQCVNDQKNNLAPESAEYQILTKAVASLDAEGALDKCLLNLTDQCTQITVGPFSQFETGLSYRPSTLLRPGARVFSTSPRIEESTNGTIGAFLKVREDEKNAGDKKKDEQPQAPRDAWLLSNKHVLLQRTQDLESVEVRGAGQTLISRRVNYIGEKFEINTVDAAVAKVEDPSDIEPFYDGIDIVCSCPVEPRPGMTVHKLGNATGVTSGKIICRLDQVFVSGRKGGGDFENQWLIGSDDTFVANGDSGSLVIGCKHPVAMLFAMADRVDGLPKEKHFIPPFGLATSITTVLTEITRELGFKKDELEIMLGHKPKAPCPYPHLHPGCPPKPKKCPEQNPPPEYKQEQQPKKQHDHPKS